MQIKLFHKSQKELANAINTVIDQYYNDEIDEVVLKRLIFSLVKNNESKVFKDKNFTTIIKQRCGKRRLELLEKIIINEDRRCDQ
ncbi:MAG TPA: glycosyl transferase [Lachnospiraceae bacterium]|nr:glycosyl transferase [Lachnospiraceae bacterium]